MINSVNVKEKIYEDCPERELELMWQDIKNKNYKNLNNNLINSIEKQKNNIKKLEIKQYAKQIWDSELRQYVDFDMWKAYEIVNDRKERLLMRRYEPLVFQNEFREEIWSWKNYDCSYIEHSLRENEILKNVEVKKCMVNDYPPFSERDMTPEQWRKMRDQDKAYGRY